MTQNLIKAELHAHLEGTLSPEMLFQLAERNQVDVPFDIITPDHKNYRWDEHPDAGKNLLAFVNAYDRATNVIKTPKDYFDITYDYLRRCAEENSIYEELTIYADPEPTVGISYAAMLDALSDAIDRARTDFSIETRLLAAFVRHYGVERSIKDAETVVANPHKYVTGITMAGAEDMHAVADFVPAYRRVHAALGLDMTAHAGEATGPETIRACHEMLGITRFGHMVRVVEDADLMHQLAEKGCVAEVCPSSNIVLKVYDSLDDHPLNIMHEAGLKLTLNSDDPPFFKTTLGHEYELGYSHFGLTEQTLNQFTRNAIEAAFVDEQTRTQLLGRLGPV